MNHRLVVCLCSVLSAGGLVAVLQQVGLAQQQAAVPEASLLHVLTSDYVGFDEYASASHDLAGRGSQAVPLLVQQLPSSGDLAKLRILGTISRIGPAAASALPELRRLLQEGSPPVRAAAADCVRALGPAGREALPDLFKALGDADGITVGTATRAIDALDPDFVGTRLKDLLDRLGTCPATVDQLQLRTWYGLANRTDSGPALARDLHHWMLVVRITDREKLRIADVLGPGQLSSEARQTPPR